MHTAEFTLLSGDRLFVIVENIVCVTDGYHEYDPNGDRVPVVQLRLLDGDAWRVLEDYEVVIAAIDNAREAMRPDDRRCQYTLRRVSPGSPIRYETACGHTWRGPIPDDYAYCFRCGGAVRLTC